MRVARRGITRARLSRLQKPLHRHDGWSTRLHALQANAMCFSVFSPFRFPRQLPGGRQRRQRRASVVPDASWRCPNGHPTTSRRRPEGEDCQCPADEHEGGWCRWLQQHHAECVCPRLGGPECCAEVHGHLNEKADAPLGLYTDESPGLKIDPVIVLVLSLVFIFSVVALHSKLLLHRRPRAIASSNRLFSYCQDYPTILELSELTGWAVERRGSDTCRNLAQVHTA